MKSTSRFIEETSGRVKKKKRRKTGREGSRGLEFTRDRKVEADAIISTYPGENSAGTPGGIDE